MRRLWCVLLVLGGLALAQSQPIDSLVRPQDRPGQLRYSLALRYAPLQTSGLGEEAERGIFAFTRVEHGLLLSGALELTLDATWKAFVGLSPELAPPGHRGAATAWVGPRAGRHPAIMKGCKAAAG